MARQMCLLIIANSSSPGFTSVNARVGVMDLNRLFWHPKQLAMVKKGCISVDMLIYFMVIIIFNSYHGSAHRYPLIRCRVLFSFIMYTVFFYKKKYEDFEYFKKTSSMGVLSGNLGSIITTKMVNFPVKEVRTRSTKKQHDGVPTFKVRKDVMMLPFVQNGRIMSAEDDIQSSSVQPYQPFTTI
jgi:hypothetical protein